MEDPIFTLSNVVKTKGEMQDFTGPLSLILQLLSKNKIEIKDISISLILEQYLAYLDTMSEMNLEIASEFVAMASYLVYIKTKTLLSGTDDKDELGELISSLEELQHRENYQQIKSVTGLLAEMFRSNCGLMVKPPEYLAPQNEYKYEHGVMDLVSVFAQMIDKEEMNGLNAVKAVIYPKRITYSVTEKASEILRHIRACGETQIRDLIANSRSRSEVVAVFIAVLELCRTGSIYLVGYEEELTICCGTDTAGIDEMPNFDDVAE
jgi:segregation and condensation protein A